MRFFISVVSVLLALTTIAANAEPVAGLYQVREELVSQESAVRDAGLQQAFVTLMQRLTGQADAAQSAKLAEYRADPQALISRYGYEGNTLIVNFDPQSVQAAVRKANLPLWGSNRPAVLTWWMLNDVEGLRLVTDGQASAPILHSAGQYYGVPVRIPLGDLDEQLLVSADALTDSQPIRDTAERYTADAVLLVQQVSADAALQAQWQLWLGDEQQQGQVSADSQEALARAVLAQVNQRLAQRFAIKPGAGESFEVRVAGVNLERFVLLERLLEPFAAQLQEVTEDYAQWRVRSTAEQLRAQMTLAHVQEKPLPEPQLTESTDGSQAPLAVTPSVNAADANTQLLYFSW
ncbi:MAG: DUF2066 domain-containing protein [Gammaproteobacteria bacterium]|nr:DUF2066 domain-containing protein [Gammaproteobacteria bacterium]